MTLEKRLIERLKADGLIPNKEFKGFKEIVGILKWEDKRIPEIFKSFGFKFSPSIPEPDKNVISKVSRTFMRKERLIPVTENEKSVSVATDNPFEKESVKNLEWIFLKPVTTLVVPFDKINEFLSGQNSEGTFSEEKDRSEEEDIISTVSEVPVVQFINDMLTTAVRVRASDIHFEPFKNGMRIRLRVDGVLHKIAEVPLSHVPSVISRLKIMSNLDIAEKRLPQDGKINIKVGGKQIDIRVSTLPTQFGERVVLRLLSHESILYSTKNLGLLDDDYKKFENLIHLPHGIILVTGPTGSGKTTTLYSALSEINNEQVNILTVEDPIEYRLNGISQVQVKPDIGLTFSSALRSILRQDPDIIMIGEIRDRETAEIAVQAALTGHLVFSTLHTNDAPSSVTRLVDMGIEPFLVASSVVGVVAQRLVRKICPYCKMEYIPTKEELSHIGLKNFKGKLYKGKGCERCMNTGYLGRTAIYEIMAITKEIRKAILNGSDSDVIRDIAVNEGMKTLKMDGISKIKMGITTVEEVLRVARV